MAAAPPRGSVLIVDANAGEALRAFVTGEGYEAHTAQSPGEAVGTLAAGRFDLVLMDIDYAGGGADDDLLGAITALDRDLPVVLLTPMGSVERATEGMRRGARDFVRKPWEPARLTSILRNQMELRRALVELRRLETRSDD